jgi:NTE family protein
MFWYLLRLVTGMWFSKNGHKLDPTLVLSGGGSMGALQAGLLRVLMLRGFVPARIVGTSVGALNGAFLAFHPDLAGVDRLAEIWRSLEKEHYLTFNPVRVAYRLASRQLHLFSNEFLRRLIAEYAVEDDFAQTKIPLYVTATNFHTGRKRVFSTGQVSQAVLASTAIPGVFGPIEVDGERYIDGGVVANLDLETAVELGAKEVLAIDLSHCFELPEAANFAGVITRTVDIVMRERVDRDMAQLSRKARITLVQPEIEEGPSLGDLRHAARLIEEGEHLGERIATQCFDQRGRLRPGVFTAAAAVHA